MIETSDIYRTLRQTLEKNFENIKVQIKDVKNPKPPCFYVKFINGVTRQSADEYMSDSIIFDVIYFSLDLTLKDLLSKEKLLKKIFKKPLKIKLDDETVQYQEIENVSINCIGIKSRRSTIWWRKNK